MKIAFGVLPSESYHRAYSVPLFCHSVRSPRKSICPDAWVPPSEQVSYDAFSKEPVVETKIALGEQFDQKYPHSHYKESVDTQLAFLYFNKADTARNFTRRSIECLRRIRRTYPYWRWQDG